MLVLNVSQVIATDEGAVVNATKGVLVNVYPSNPVTREVDGVSTQGSLQNAELKDETGTIKVVFSDREDLRPLKGKTVYILAKKGARGFTGTKRKLDTFRNANKPALWVYDQATVTQDAPDGKEPPADTAPAPGATKAATSSAPARQPANPNEAPEDKAAREQAEANAKARAFALARISIAKSANLMLLCLNAADYVASQYEDKHEGKVEYFMGPSDIRTLATTLYIQAERDGLSGSMPADALSIKPKTAAQ